MAPMHVCRATVGVDAMPTYNVHMFERLHHRHPIVSPTAACSVHRRPPSRTIGRYQHDHCGARHPSSLPHTATWRCLWGLFPCLTSSACWQAAGAAGAAVGDNPALLVPPVKLPAPVLAGVCTLAAPLQVLLVVLVWTWCHTRETPAQS